MAGQLGILTLPGFSWRIAVLVVLMLVVSLVDVYRHGAKATRFREYGFILFAGLLGGVVGMVNDLITSSISPEYFIWGKGLEEGGQLRLEAVAFGLQEGFSAGVIGGAICLFATQRKSEPLAGKFSGLFRSLWMPVAGTICCAIVLPVVASRFDPAHFVAQLNTVLNAEKIDRFREVWWIHIGLYAGLVIGLTAMIRRIVHGRKSVPGVNKEKEPDFSGSR
jgi:hypothetical protein